MLQTDTKAISQFIKKGLEKKDIVLKSEGTQLYSYSYVADAVSGMLTILLKGTDGEAYNVADKESDITLKELAHLVAENVESNVVFEIPDKLEAAGYSKATKALMNSSKLQKLGWKARWNIEDGIKETLNILQIIKETELSLE